MSHTRRPPLQTAAHASSPSPSRDTEYVSFSDAFEVEGVVKDVAYPPPPPPQPPPPDLILQRLPQCAGVLRSRAIDAGPALVNSAYAAASAATASNSRAAATSATHPANAAARSAIAATSRAAAAHPAATDAAYPATAAHPADAAAGPAIAATRPAIAAASHADADTATHSDIAAAAAAADATATPPTLAAARHAAAAAATQPTATDAANADDTAHPADASTPAPVPVEPRGHVHAMRCPQASEWLGLTRRLGVQHAFCAIGHHGGDVLVGKGASLLRAAPFHKLVCVRFSSPVHQSGGIYALQRVKVFGKARAVTGAKITDACFIEPLLFLVVVHTCACIWDGE